MGATAERGTEIRPDHTAARQTKFANCENPCGLVRDQHEADTQGGDPRLAGRPELSQMLPNADQKAGKPAVMARRSASSTSPRRAKISRAQSA
jgi:hypothetical protein